MSQLLFNAKYLAAQLQHDRGYVSAMKRLGFKPVRPGLYSLESAIKWLESHPDFRTTTAYPCKARKKAQSNDLAAQMARLQSAAADSLKRI